jgi:hypothetical protein
MQQRASSSAPILVDDCGSAVFEQIAEPIRAAVADLGALVKHLAARQATASHPSQ